MHIKYGYLSALNITEFSDRSFIETILFLHDGFVSAQDLFSSLTVAYHLARRDEDSAVQRKVIDIMKSWVSGSWVDFYSNPLVSLQFTKSDS